MAWGISLKLPRVHTQRFSFVLALFHLTFGFALYVFAGEFSLSGTSPFRPQVHLLAATLMMSGFALLLLALYRLKLSVRVALTLMTLAPFIVAVSLHSSGSSPLGVFIYTLLQIATLLLPWLSEPEEGYPAPDLLNLFQGFAQIGIVIFLLFSTVRDSDLGVIGDHPVLITLVCLLGSASLLWPRRIGPFSRYHIVRRLLASAGPLLLAASLLHGDHYVSGLLAALIGLTHILLTRIPQRDPVLGSASFGATDDSSSERLAELWTWLILVATVLLALTESMIASRPPSGLVAIFVLCVIAYILVSKWFLPPMGAPRTRIAGHLIFLALAQGLVLAPSSHISLSMLVPAVASCLLAARQFGRHQGYRMLVFILMIIAVSVVVDGLVAGNNVGLILSGLLVRVLIGAGAGLFAVVTMSEQYNLVRDLVRTKERLQVSYSDLQVAHEQLVVQSARLAAQSDELIAQGAELSKLVNFDPLTGLTNRRRFDEVLALCLNQAIDGNEGGALLFIDLDGFKFVNDRFGHKEGDRLLSRVAVMLVNSVREEDVVARLGGDEFAILLTSADKQAAIATVERILKLLRDEPITMDGVSVLIRASIGVTLFPAHGVRSEELLANADVAMYAAKDAGRDAYSLYGGWHNGKAIPSAITMEREIRSALASDRMFLHLQPILDLQSDSVTRYEALIRMVNSTGDLLPPGEFLPAAERHGLIDQIDRWVIHTAIDILMNWEEQGLNLELAINLSGRAFRDISLPGQIADRLDAGQVQPCRLIIEITETAAIANLDLARSFIEELRAIGCRIAIDDFGVGFSSFSYLKNLPVDYLKIDGSFIQNLTTDLRDQHMVLAMVAMAQGLGIKTTAEFVGESESVSMLRRFGVDSAQGYYVGRPEPHLSMPNRLHL